MPPTTRGFSKVFFLEVLKYQKASKKHSLVATQGPSRSAFVRKGGLGFELPLAGQQKSWAEQSEG